MVPGIFERFVYISLQFLVVPYIWYSICIFCVYLHLLNMSSHVCILHVYVAPFLGCSSYMLHCIVICPLDYCVCLPEFLSLHVYAPSVRMSPLWLCHIVRVSHCENALSVPVLSVFMCIPFYVCPFRVNLLWCLYFSFVCMSFCPYALPCLDRFVCMILPCVSFFHGFVRP